MAVDLWTWFVANRNLAWVASFLVVIGLTLDNHYEVLPYMTRRRRYLIAGLIFIATSLAWMYADGGLSSIISKIAGISVGVAIGSIVALDKIIEHLQDS